MILTEPKWHPLYISLPFGNNNEHYIPNIIILPWCCRKHRDGIRTPLPQHIVHCIVLIISSGKNVIYSNPCAAYDQNQNISLTRLFWGPRTIDLNIEWLCDQSKQENLFSSFDIVTISRCTTYNNSYGLLFLLSSIIIFFIVGEPNTEKSFVIQTIGNITKKICQSNSANLASTPTSCTGTLLLDQFILDAALFQLELILLNQPLKYFFQFQCSTNYKNEYVSFCVYIYGWEHYAWETLVGMITSSSWGT